jgi:alkaline phosphatase D
VTYGGKDHNLRPLRAGTISRRAFLAGLAATGVLTACSSNGGDSDSASGGGSDDSVVAAEPRPAPDLGGDPFGVGVASGDPLSDSVILWTRLVVDPLAPAGGIPDEEVDLVWEVASDEGFGDVVAQGVATASPDLGHSVHVDVSGLDADSWYWYRFTVGEATSPVARTRTLPETDAEPEQMAFAFASCQSWGSGYYTAWRYAAEDDLDLVVHLGDYIYENGELVGDVRQAEVGPALDLPGYRTMYALYKSDPDLQAAHARFPFVFTWDDHEVDNDYAADQQEDADPVDAFLERRAAAYQAWYESLPVRIDPPEGPDLEIYQAVDFGTLARFYLLDTRQHRDDQPCSPAGGPSQGTECGDELDDARTILGPAQEEWLDGAFAEGDAIWNVIGSSVMVTPLPFTQGAPRAFNFDQWDGFVAARQRLVDSIVANEVTNPVVICGDVHWSQVSGVPSVPEDPDSELLITELVGTSISSSPDDAQAAAIDAILENVPNVQWSNARQRGYVRVTVTPDEMTADYRLLVTALETESEVDDTTWKIQAGTAGATEA